jgi:D-ribose pyranose/furanose isomerase RbsD
MDYGELMRGHIPLEEVLAVARGEQILGTNVLATEIEELRNEKKEMKEAIIKMSENYREVIVAIDKLKAVEKKSKKG